jgi:Transposase
MVAVMIGVDPHQASHTAVAIGAAEEPVGQLRVRASAAQAERLLAWAQAWPRRTWAVEDADGVGHLPGWQLLAAGERVLDVQPKVSARVRLLAAGDTNKNDPDDARSVAVAALRSAGVREARADDHAAVLKVWSKRHRDLGRTRTQVVCRLHAVLCELVPGGVCKRITAGQAARILGSITPAGAVAAARCELAAAFIGDLSRIDAQLRETRKKLTAAVHLPAVPARQPPAQPRHPHGRSHPGQPPAQRGPRLLREEAGRGQDPERGPALAEAADQRCHLRLPASRRPARRSLREQPGRARGERLCRQRGRLTPPKPALRTSHSRACHHPTTPAAADPATSSFPLRCHPARADGRVQDRAEPGRAAAPAGRP